MSFSPFPLAGKGSLSVSKRSRPWNKLIIPGQAPSEFSLPKRPHRLCLAFLQGEITCRVLSVTISLLKAQPAWWPPVDLNSRQRLPQKRRRFASPSPQKMAWVVAKLSVYVFDTFIQSASRFCVNKKHLSRIVSTQSTHSCRHHTPGSSCTYLLLSGMELPTAKIIKN